MDELLKIRKLYKLKNVKRTAPVGDRKESPAEHSWSCLILADYFMGRISEKVDRLKVYELLMYHDVSEIYAGDTSPEEKSTRTNKSKEEMDAAIRLSKELPSNTGKKFISLFKEFEEDKTPEARFAKAVDRMDAFIHFLDYKKAWAGWDEKRLREFYKECFDSFPEVSALFEQLIQYAKKNGYGKDNKKI